MSVDDSRPRVSLLSGMESFFSGEQSGLLSVRIAFRCGVKEDFESVDALAACWCICLHVPLRWVDLH